MTNTVSTTTARAVSLPLHMPALADDTPSRHPCKIRIPSAQKRFMFDPYKAQVTLGLESTSDNCESSNDDSDDGVNDDAFGAEVQQPTGAPKPVDASSPLTRQNQFPGACAPAHSSPQQGHRNTITNEAKPQHNRENAAPTAAARQQTNSTPSHEEEGASHHHHHSLSRGLSSNSPTPAIPSSQQDGLPQHVSGAHYTNADGCYRMHAGNVHHALVRFKFSEDVYVVPLCDRRSLCVGDLAVVEGDRGENIGQVICDLSSQYDEKDMSQKPMIRRALNKDRKKYYHARRKDALASKAAQQLVQDNGLKMHVLDAEFQADLMKLTIYFRSFAGSGEAIDFREMQRGMFKQFRCRIWLINWDEDKHLQQLVQQQLHQVPNKPTAASDAAATTTTTHTVVGAFPMTLPAILQQDVAQAPQCVNRQDQYAAAGAMMHHATTTATMSNVKRTTSPIPAAAAPTTAFVVAGTSRPAGGISSFPSF